MSDATSALAALQAADKLVDVTARVDAFEHAAQLALHEHNDAAQALARFGLFEATATSVHHEIDMGSMMWLFDAADRGLLRGALLTRVLDTARRVLWQMRSNAGVPLRTIHATLQDLERRYDLAGCSPRKLRIFRTMLAIDTGSVAQIRSAHKAWQDAPFGTLGGTAAGDCAAQALVYAELGDYATALLTAQQLDDGESAPHLASNNPASSESATAALPPSDLVPLAQACSLDWYVREGELDRAVQTHLGTWRTAKAEKNADLCVSHHLAFLARMGRADRALELGLPFFTLDAGNTDDARMRLLAVSHGVLRLALRRGIAPVAVHGVPLREYLSQSLHEAIAIAEQFDSRGGTDRATYQTEQLAYLTPYSETTSWPDPWGKPEHVTLAEPQPVDTDSFVELGAAVTRAVDDFSTAIWSLSAHWKVLRQRANPMLSTERKVAATLGLLRVVTSSDDVALREFPSLRPWVDGSYDRITSLRYEALSLLPPMSEDSADWHAMMEVAEELVTLEDNAWVCLLLRRAASAWESVGEFEGALELCDSVIDLAHDTGLAAHEGIARTDAAGILARAGGVGAAQAQLQAAEEAVMFASANTTTAQWLAQAAVAATKRDDSAYLASLKAALACAPDGAYSVHLSALADLSRYHRSSENFDEARHLANQMRAFALAEGSDDQLAAALHGTALVLLAQGEPEAAAEKLEASVALRVPTHPQNWASLTVLARVLTTLGEHNAAATQWRAAAALARDRGDGAHTVLAQQHVAMSLTAAGDNPSAVDAAQQAEADAWERGTTTDVVSAAQGLAEALAAVGQIEEALQILTALTDRVTAFAREQRGEDEVSDEQLRHVTAQATLTAARVLVQDHRWHDALDAAQEAEGLLGEFSLSDAARAVVLQAEAMQNLGRTDDARQVLADAVSATDDSGARAVLEDARYILQEIIEATERAEPPQPNGSAAPSETP